MWPFTLIHIHIRIRALSAMSILANLDTKLSGHSRVARCPVFNRTIRYLGPLSGIKMIVIPYNAWVNSSVFSATDTGTHCVRCFGDSHLATLWPERMPGAVSGLSLEDTMSHALWTVIISYISEEEQRFRHLNFCLCKNPTQRVDWVWKARYPVRRTTCLQLKWPPYCYCSVQEVVLDRAFDQVTLVFLLSVVKASDHESA